MKTTALFNGALKDKFKSPLPDQTSALRALARGGACDKKVYDITLDESMIPLPTELLKHELDNDVMMQDTILGLCDKDGTPLKWKYLADTMDDVRELLQCESFFNQIPMCDDFNYFVARDWMGVPVKKYEIDSIARQRKIFEKRAMKKRQDYERRMKQRKKDSSKTIQFLNEKNTITF